MTKNTTKDDQTLSKDLTDTNKQNDTKGKANGTENATIADALKDLQPKTFNRPDVVAPLPTWEVYANFIAFTSIVVMMFRSMYYSSIPVEFEYKYNDSLVKGWSILGRDQDHSDGEWSIFTNHLHVTVPIITIHIVISLLCNQFCYKYRKHAWLTVGVSGVFAILGWRVVLFLFALCTVYYALTFARQILLVWALGLTVIWNTEKWLMVIAGHHEGFLLLAQTAIGLAFIHLGIISFAVERIRKLKGTSELDPKMTFSYFDLVVFAFYQPKMYYGPNYIYKYFQSQADKEYVPFTRDEVIYIFKKFLRVFVWGVVVEIWISFFYIATMTHSMGLKQRIPLWSLGGLCWGFNAFYMTTYCVSYGLCGCFMSMDRIVPPTLPRCVARVCNFSEHWRFFDPGLHAFFRNYIYIPLGGSRHGIIRQIAAMAMSFMFVSFWHGFYAGLRRWALCNFIGLTLEVLVNKFAAKPAVKEFEERVFGKTWTRRIHTIINVPNFLLGNYAIMTFHSNINHSFVIIDRFFLKGTVITWIMAFIYGYTLTTVSTETERWEQSRSLKTAKTE